MSPTVDADDSQIVPGRTIHGHTRLGIYRSGGWTATHALISLASIRRLPKYWRGGQLVALRS